MCQDNSQKVTREGSDVILGLPLSGPEALQGATGLFPIGLAVALAIAIYFPAFFKTAFLFGVLVLPPFAIWSWALFFWAREQKLTGNGVSDRRIRLRTTRAHLLFVWLGSPVVSIVFLLIGLQALSWGSAVSSVGYVSIVAAYSAIFMGSFLVFPDRLVRLELDRLCGQPETWLGRRLAAGKALPRLATLATTGVILVALLRVLLPRGWQGALLGVSFLLLSLYMIHGSVVNFHRWRLVRQMAMSESQDGG